MTDDLELLRAYAAVGSEDAFRTVLERHVNLVHSVALRQVRNPHLAQEVTQAVFVVLARKAASLHDGTMLAGWLFRTTRFVATRALRNERRRQRREQEAAQMEIIDRLPAPEASWDEIAPLLDEAVAGLHEKERQAILLRFFERREFKEVGQALGHSEDAAKKRVARALEKLRIFFIRRGAVLSTGALVGVLMDNAVQAAPTGVSTAAGAIATANGAAASTLVLAREALRAMLYAKLKTAALTLTLALALISGGFAVGSLRTPKTTIKPSTQFYPLALENLEESKPLSSYGSNDLWWPVPTGAQVFAGVPFRVTTKLQMHANIEAKDERFYPERIVGIPVHQRLGRLHVFNGANIPDDEGAPMAALRLNYADGFTHTLMFTYAFNTREWWRNPGASNYNIFDTNTVIAWTGTSAGTRNRGPEHWHRLYRTTFDLPAHDSPVETIDMFSLFYNSSLVVLGMTGEAPSATAGKALPSIDDSQYRRSLILRVIDRAGDAVPGATARGFAVNERGQAVPLGKLADSLASPGDIPVDFPTGTRELQLLVSAARGVTELNLQSTPAGIFNSNIVVRLEQGTTMGGYVRDMEGRPLEKAKVEMFRAARNNKGELLLSKYGETKTDSKGRWKIKEVPVFAGECLVRVKLSGFATGEFIVGDGSSKAWTRETFLASRAEFRLAANTNKAASLDAAKPNLEGDPK
jgi:RNA polymerase sigma factor (sigma-70 family)